MSTRLMVGTSTEFVVTKTCSCNLYIIPHQFHDCLCKMLENKKRCTDLSLEDENLYVNQAYGRYHYKNTPM